MKLQTIAILMLAACRAPVATTVQTPHVAAVPTPTRPIRQDYVDMRPAMPLDEVITTGRECTTPRQPILFVGRDVATCAPIIRRR
jgi:hypothetical protein